MGLTYAECVRLGIAHLYPKDAKVPPAAPPPPSRVDAEAIGGKVFADFDSKLEWQFWQRLWAAHESGVYFEVDHHTIKVRAIADASWFTVDFVARGVSSRTIFETKGYLREKDKLRLIGAASRYPEWTWIIVMRDKGKWECRRVDRHGINREGLTLAWLQ